MKADSSVELFLRQLEERLLQPDFRKSAKDLADILADKFIEFGSSGHIFNKQQIIESLQNESIEPLEQKSIEEFNTLVLAAGVILVTYRIVKHNVSGGQPVNSLRSSIWKLFDKKWKIVFHQGTSLKKS